MTTLLEGTEQLERQFAPPREPFAAPAAGSLLLHGLLFGSLLLTGILNGLFHHNVWGNPGAGSAIQVSLVSNALPLPADRPLNKNVLATDTPSNAPAEPSPKTKQAIDDTAIPLLGKQVKPQKETAQKTQLHQPPPKQDNRAQFGEQSGSSMPRATMAQNTASNGPVSITNGDFGSRFGWYVEIIKRKVSQNWNRYEVDSRTPKGANAEIYFRVNRQGVPANFKINTASGSPTLDQSCLRATQRVDTFGNLPPDSNDQWLDVTYDCTY
jgi:periplasmic protein TonB